MLRFYHDGAICSSFFLARDGSETYRLHVRKDAYVQCVPTSTSVSVRPLMSVSLWTSTVHQANKFQPYLPYNATEVS